jgi:hypothetical protein
MSFMVCHSGGRGSVGAGCAARAEGFAAADGIADLLEPFAPNGFHENVDPSAAAASAHIIGTIT